MPGSSSTKICVLGNAFSVKWPWLFWGGCWWSTPPPEKIVESWMKLKLVETNYKISGWMKKALVYKPEKNVGRQKTSKSWDFRFRPLRIGQCGTPSKCPIFMARTQPNPQPPIWAIYHKSLAWMFRPFWVGNPILFTTFWGDLGRGQGISDLRCSVHIQQLRRPGVEAEDVDLPR